MHKILPILGIISLTVFVYPCFAEEAQQICPGVENMLDLGALDSNGNPSNVLNVIANVHSYKATGKIYFLKKCADREELCKTGSYIIAGDYFIAMPKVNNYYCAAYIPNGYQHPKALGLIKGENFAETKPEEYKKLHFTNSSYAIWTSLHDPDAVFYVFNNANPLESAQNIPAISAKAYLYTPADENDVTNRDGIPNETPFSTSYILKTGKKSFVGTSADGIFDMRLKSGKLIIHSPARYAYSDLNGTYMFQSRTK